jgi:hypothetical protein
MIEQLIEIPLGIKQYQDLVKEVWDIVEFPNYISRKVYVTENIEKLKENSEHVSRLGPIAIAFTKTEDSDLYLPGFLLEHYHPRENSSLGLLQEGILHCLLNSRIEHVTLNHYAYFYVASPSTTSLHGIDKTVEKELRKTLEKIALASKISGSQGVEKDATAIDNQISTSVYEAVRFILKRIENGNFRWEV